MRHTLLPLHERILLRREYHIRVAIVFCFVLSLAILIGISALFPTFIRARLAEAEAEKSAVEAEKGAGDNVVKEIQKNVARSLILLNSLNKNSKMVSDLITEALNMRGEVRFTGFSANIVSTTTFSMNIQGIAPTRNDLLSFKSKFENLAPGNKVELPVSELAKSTNVQFSLQLKRKLP